MLVIIKFGVNLPRIVLFPKFTRICNTHSGLEYFFRILDQNISYKKHLWNKIYLSFFLKYFASYTILLMHADLFL